MIKIRDVENKPNLAPNAVVTRYWRSGQKWLHFPVYNNFYFLHSPSVIQQLELLWSSDKGDRNRCLFFFFPWWSHAATTAGSGVGDNSNRGAFCTGWVKQPRTTQDSVNIFYCEANLWFLPVWGEKLRTWCLWLLLGSVYSLQLSGKPVGLFSLSSHILIILLSLKNNWTQNCQEVNTVEMDL